MPISGGMMGIIVGCRLDGRQLLFDHELTSGDFPPAIAARFGERRGEEERLVKRRALGYLVAAAAVSCLAGPRECWAGASLTLTTNQLSLDDVDDAAGLWQHEGGTLTCADGTHVGNYTVTRRVTLSGTGPENTAAVTMTLFFLGSSPPENITIEAAHDYYSGGYIGSVSAASQAFESIRGRNVAGEAGPIGTVTINKLGNAKLNPCRSVRR
jgi:hypothetical protein